MSNAAISKTTHTLCRSTTFALYGYGMFKMQMKVLRWVLLPVGSLVY